MTDTDSPEPDLEPTAEGCPNRGGMIFVNTVTGAVALYRCGRNSCAYCVQGNARRRARAIAFAKPERAILLTQVGDDWQVVRLRMAKLKYFLQQEIDKSFEWVFHVEPNPKGTGHHVHAWERGAYIPQPSLSSVAERVGMGGFARINKIHDVTQASNYGLKGLGYGMKGVQAEDSRVAYLVANGRRLTHQSRGFFVDSTTEASGVRKIEKLAAATGREQVGTWVLMGEY